jgi:hypothetical protein
MRAAEPDELRENAFPVMTARMTEAELEKWFPVPFQEITDPWAVLEPTRGALVQLNAGDYVVLYWGRDSQELTVRIPANTDPSVFLGSFLREVAVPRSRISWRRPGARLPRNVAAKSIAIPSRHSRRTSPPPRKTGHRTPRKS